MEVEEARTVEEDSFDSYLTQVSMGVDDDGLQGYFSSLASNLASGVASQKEDALSLEDAAWVESCLVKDFENSDDNWDDMKEALFSIISSQVLPPTFEVSDKTLEINNDCSNATLLQDSTRDHISPNTVHVEENGDDETKVATFLRDHLVYNHINSEENEGGEAKVAAFFHDHLVYNHINSEENEGGEAKVAAFLHDHLVYNHANLEENEGGEANVAAASMEDTESSENIFRVWDLGMQFEVDELTKQLAKAHEEGSICDDLGGATSNDKIFDDLLVGMADLSLDPRI